MKYLVNRNSIQIELSYHKCFIRRLNQTFSIPLKHFGNELCGIYLNQNYPQNGEKTVKV